MLCVYNVDIETFDIHGQISHGLQDYFYMLHCIHNVGIET